MTYVTKTGEIYREVFSDTLGEITIIHYIHLLSKKYRHMLIPSFHK